LKLTNKRVSAGLLERRLRNKARVRTVSDIVSCLDAVRASDVGRNVEVVEATGGELSAGCEPDVLNGIDSLAPHW
jgi:hypothetical protein